MYAPLFYKKYLMQRLIMHDVGGVGVRGGSNDTKEATTLDRAAHFENIRNVQLKAATHNALNTISISKNLYSNIFYNQLLLLHSMETLF